MNKKEERIILLKYWISSGLKTINTCNLAITILSMYNESSDELNELKKLKDDTFCEIDKFAGELATLRQESTFKKDLLSIK